MASDLPSYAWIAADGTETFLAAPYAAPDAQGNLALVRSRDGFDAIPRTFVESALPGVAGTRLRQTIRAARDLDLNLYLEAQSLNAIRALIRGWVGRFDSDDAGWLRVYGPDGARQIRCAYAGGLETARLNGPSATATVSFRAFDPFFYAARPVTTSVAVAAAPAFYPILPLVLSASVVSDTPAVTNDGDSPAFPVWTLRGPALSMTLTSAAGEVLAYAAALTGDQTLTIDTRPDVGTVRVTAADGTVTSGYRNLTAAAEFWTIPPGSVSFTVNVPGATQGTLLTASFTPRFRSA